MTSENRVGQYLEEDVTEIEGLFSSRYSEKGHEQPISSRGEIEEKDIKILIESMIYESRSPLKAYLEGIKGFAETNPKLYMKAVSEVLFRQLFDIRHETRIHRREIDLLKMQLGKISSQMRSYIYLGSRDFLLSATGILIGSILLVTGFALHLNFVLFCGFGSIVIGILHTIRMK